MKRMHKIMFGKFPKSIRKVLVDSSADRWVMNYDVSPNGAAPRAR